MRFTLRKVLKWGIVTGVIGGSAVVLQKNDWQVSTLGLFRFGRAAFAVS